MLPTERPLTNHDIIKYVKVLKIPHFRGVYMRDNLPMRAKKVECWIINLDSEQSAGTYWTALAKIDDKAWYFDSFGKLLPPLEVKKYLGDRVKIVYNYNNFQKFDTFLCGHLCLAFLLKFWKENNGIKK